MKITAFNFLHEEAASPEGEGGAAGGATAPSAISSGGEAPKPFAELLPEKFRVFEGDGDAKQFNLEASAGKLWESYAHLEKRVGNYEAPPDTPDAYQLDGKAFGEEFNVEEFMKQEENKSFLAKAHAHGMTNKQVQMVMEHALKDFAPNLMQGQAEMSVEQCVSGLKGEVWKSEAEFKTNMSAANRAFMSLPESLRGTIDKTLGNNPAFIQAMALFGKEMAEDRPPQETNTQEQSSIEELMLSDAYKNEKHPQHAQVSARIKAYFEKKFPQGSAA